MARVAGFSRFTPLHPDRRADEKKYDDSSRDIHHADGLGKRTLTSAPINPLMRGQGQHTHAVPLYLYRGCLFFCGLPRNPADGRRFGHSHFPCTGLLPPSGSRNVKNEWWNRKADYLTRATGDEDQQQQTRAVVLAFPPPMQRWPSAHVTRRIRLARDPPRERPKNLGSGSRWPDVTQLHIQIITSAMPTSCLRANHPSAPPSSRDTHEASALCVMRAVSKKNEANKEEP